MEEEKRKAYSEVVEILKLIDNEEKIEKIPFEVIQLIKTNSDPTYKPQISTEIPLEEQNLMDETYVILGWIASKYWGENVYDVNEKEKIEEVNNKDNEEQIIKEESEERIVRNAAVYNDMEPSLLDDSLLNKQEDLPMLLSEIKWYQKIKNQVIRFLKKIFRINKNKDKEGVNE